MAKESLKDIYNYYNKSEQGAKNVLTYLLNAPNKIVYAKQYQLDEINSKYRRIIVRDYKLLYMEKNNRIEVVDIVSTRQSPKILKKK